MNSQPLSLDWWVHQIYRQTKEFILTPSREMEMRLTALIAEYRAHHEKQPAPPNSEDEHERVMDYR